MTMTPADHVAKAEDLLEKAAEGSATMRALYLAEAQVHSTLAIFHFLAIPPVIPVAAVPEEVVEVPAPAPRKRAARKTPTKAAE